MHPVDISSELRKYNSYDEDTVELLLGSDELREGGEMPKQQLPRSHQQDKETESTAVACSIESTFIHSSTQTHNNCSIIKYLLFIFFGVLYVTSQIILKRDHAHVSHPSGTTTVTMLEELVLTNDDNSSIFDLIAQKQQSIKDLSGKDCFCPNGRNNWIHYTNCPSSGAGIKDRQNILRNMMWYADELCAKIALECTPNAWLSEQHGCYVPVNATWDVYFTPVRLNASQTVIESRADIIHLGINTTSVFKGLKTIYNASVQGYEAGKKLYSNGIPFVWEFDRSFWKTDLHNKGFSLKKKIDQSFNHRPYNDTCGKLDFEASNEILNVGQLLLEQLGIQNSFDFVTLHLRRGDYMKCPNDPATVMNYVNCSMANDNSENVKKIVVLTNGEREYIQNLTKAFSTTFPTKEVIILDQFITSDSFMEKLKESDLLSVHSGDDFLKDNCIRFSAEKVLVSLARYHLERGHIHCRSCDPGGVMVAGTAIVRH